MFFIYKAQYIIYNIYNQIYPRYTAGRDGWWLRLACGRGWVPERHGDVEAGPLYVVDRRYVKHDN